MATTPSIESVLQEDRVFPPPAAFAAGASVKSMADYEAMARLAADSPESFWAEVARSLYWSKPWSKVLDWQPPDAKWFVGATTNVAYNCLDRHLTTARRNKAAILFEGEPGDTRVITYDQLHREVCQT